MKRGVLPHVLAIVVAFLLVGCATAKINWAERVGHYHYDQAILDMGPPDRSAKLTDGSTVAEWLTYHGSPGYSYYSYSPYYYSPLPLYEPSIPNRYVRLTFDPQGILRSWSRISR